MKRRIRTNAPMKSVVSNNIAEFVVVVTVLAVVVVVAILDPSPVNALIVPSSQQLSSAATTLLLESQPPSSLLSSFSTRSRRRECSSSSSSFLLKSTTDKESNYNVDNHNDDKNNDVYYYFGYGSNVLPSTMKALRRIEPLQPPVAAILPHYELKFYGSSSSNSGSGSSTTTNQILSSAFLPQQPLVVEASSAFVQPVEQESSSSSPSVVHGVLYALSATDFAKLGFSEGIPFAYQWEQCSVYPYIGDGRQAGRQRLLEVTTKNKNDQRRDEGYEESPSLPSVVKAYTLGVPQRQRQQQGAQFLDMTNNSGYTEIPPSSSYLGLIQQGAELWGMDEDYQRMLQNTQVSTNVMKVPTLFSNTNDSRSTDGGVSGLALEIAERLTGTDRTYGIPLL